MNLYEMSARYQQLLDQDEYTEAEMLELETLFSDIEDECIERSKYIRNLEAQQQAIEDAASEMLERARKLHEKEVRQRDALIERMKSCGIKNIDKSPLFTINVRENPVKVDDFDKALIPEDYWRTKVTETKSIDKDLIKRCIQQGREVPGARLIRTMTVNFK